MVLCLRCWLAFGILFALSAFSEANQTEYDACFDPGTDGLISTFYTFSNEWHIDLLHGGSDEYRLICSPPTKIPVIGAGVPLPPYEGYACDNSVYPSDGPSTYFSLHRSTDDSYGEFCLYEYVSDGVKWTSINLVPTQSAGSSRPNFIGSSYRNIGIDENLPFLGRFQISGTYSFLGVSKNDDGDLFSLNGDNLIHFKNAPDYENPMDANRDNIYIATVEAKNSNGTDTLTFVITVRDAEEPPRAPVCPTFNTIPAGGSWMDFDEHIMINLIAGADCDAGQIGQAQVARRIEFLYAALFGRMFDGHGLAYWINQAARNLGAGKYVDNIMRDIATGFLNSDEFQVIATEKDLLDADGELLSSEFLAYLYNETGREGDDTGMTYWLSVIDEGGAAHMLSAFAASAATTEDGGEEDAAYLANRLQLELAVLRTAYEQNLILTTEQMQALKSRLIENRTGVLDGSLRVETLMEGL